MPSAAEQVFAIPELLEQILLATLREMPVISDYPEEGEGNEGNEGYGLDGIVNLFGLQRESRFMRAAILSSPTIGRLMGTRPCLHQEDLQSPPAGSLWCPLGSRFVTYRSLVGRTVYSEKEGCLVVRYYAEVGPIEPNWGSLSRTSDIEVGIMDRKCAIKVHKGAKESWRHTKLTSTLVPTQIDIYVHIATGLRLIGLWRECISANGWPSDGVISWSTVC
jgi:hypothetical protein